MTNIDYLLRPATEADYQYCYDLTKQNMFELFCRHWGGWNPSAFRNDFKARNTTIIIVDEQQIGYFSLKKIDKELYISKIYSFYQKFKGKVLEQQYSKVFFVIMLFAQYN